MNRLKEKYLKEVVPSLKEKYNYKSIMEVPKLEKIVINMGVGDATTNSKLLDCNACSNSFLVSFAKIIKSLFFVINIFVFGDYIFKEKLCLFWIVRMKWLKLWKDNHNH